MPKGINTEEELKLEIIEKLRSCSLRQIAKDLDIPFSTVQRIACKYKSNHSIQDGRSANIGKIIEATIGRKKVNSRRNRRIIRYVKGTASRGRLTCRQIKANLRLDIGCSAIRKILNKQGYFNKKPVKKPLLLPRHLRARLEFCKDHES